MWYNDLQRSEFNSPEPEKEFLYPSEEINFHFKIFKTEKVPRNRRDSLYYMNTSINKSLYK